MEDKVYPVRDRDTVAKMQGDYSAKLQRNIENSQKAFETGEFKPYKGVSRENMENPFYIMLELDEDSRQRVIERVVNPMEKLATTYNIPSIFAGKGDLPPHISLDIGIFNDFSPEQMEKARAWLLSNKSHLNLLSPILTGLTFHMDTLVVAPNSYICASQFGDEQGAPFRARKIIEKAMERSAKAIEESLGEQVTGRLAPPYRYDDIFYTSVSRITDFAPIESLIRFAEEINATIGEDIRANPIPVTVANVYRGRPVDFYRAYAPHLLIES